MLCQDHTHPQEQGMGNKLTQLYKISHFNISNLLLTRTLCWFWPDFTSDTCISPHKPSTEHIYPLSRLILLGITWRWGCLHPPRTLVLALEKEQFLWISYSWSSNWFKTKQLSFWFWLCHNICPCCGQSLSKSSDGSLAECSAQQEPCLCVCSAPTTQQPAGQRH